MHQRNSCAKGRYGYKSILVISGYLLIVEGDYVSCHPLERTHLIVLRDHPVPSQ